MLIEPKSSTMSVVLLGSFNPAIIDPYWLKAQDFISKELSDAAEVEIVSPEISRFAVGSFKFDVTHARMQIAVLNPPLVLLQDLIIKLLRDVLPHVKIDVFGLNRTVHFSAGSIAERTRIGRLLAPIEPWGEWGQGWAAQKGSNTSGVVDVTMTEIHPDDPLKRRTTTSVQPSVFIKDGTGIFVNVNDNYEWAESWGGKVAPVLEGIFDPFVERAEWIIDQIMMLKGEKS